MISAAFCSPHLTRDVQALGDALILDPLLDAFFRRPAVIRNGVVMPTVGQARVSRPVSATAIP
jgi:hypothetical protein